MRSTSGLWASGMLIPPVARLNPSTRASVQSNHWRSIRRAASTSQSDRTTRIARDQRGGDRIGDGQREQAAGGDILGGRDDDVGEGFGAGVDDGPRAGLAGMGDERRAAAEQEAGDLPGRVAGIDDGEAEQRAAQRPDERCGSRPRRCRPRRSCRRRIRRTCRPRRCRAPNYWRGRRAPGAGRAGRSSRTSSRGR